jgi:hypothetical protein
MPRALQNLLFRLPYRPWVRSDRRLRLTHLRHAPMVLFLMDEGFRPRHPDRFERSLRRQRFARLALFWLSAFGAAWIAIESTRALALF